MKIISICNQKGGVAKTTTSINLAAALAKLGQRVLAVDLDPQRNLSTTLDAAEGHPGINEVIYNEVAGMHYAVADYIQYNDAERVDFIAASKMLSAAPSILATDPNSRSVLSKVLRSPALERYDYIILDCRPSLDPLTANALVASDQVLVPVEAEPYAVDGLVDLWETVTSIQARDNPSLTIAGILITKVDVRTTMSRDAEAELRSCFPDLVYNTVVPRLAEAPKAADAHRSLVNTPNSRLGAIYMSIAEVILNA